MLKSRMMDGTHWVDFHDVQQELVNAAIWRKRWKRAAKHNRAQKLHLDAGMTVMAICDESNKASHALLLKDLEALRAIEAKARALAEVLSDRVEAPLKANEIYWLEQLREALKP